MKKNELVSLFEKLDIVFNEGIQFMEQNDSYPRIVFFEYLWEDILASGNNYTGLVNYQISFRSLKKLLNSSNIHPKISHEYIKDKREFHSYFSIEVLENVC